MAELDSELLPPASVHDDAPEAAIVEGIRRGELAALERLMRRYNQRLYRVARSVLADDALAEDAVQEAWISAWRGFDRYVSDGRLAAWLTRIALNEALMIRRSRQRHESRRGPGDVDDIAAPPSPGSQDGDPSAATANAELRHTIEAAVDRLPEDFRTVFMLRAVEQLSVEETASALGLKPATVKTRFHRARRLMQGSLDRELGRAEIEAFGFAGARCDRIVAAVMRRLRVPSSRP
jgi:RNA polymerase sigma-70 factor (ECF subfamily)